MPGVQAHASNYCIVKMAKGKYCPLRIKLLILLAISEIVPILFKGPNCDEIKLN